MRTIQKIEAAICDAIGALLAGGWAAAVGQLFFRGA